MSGRPFAIVNLFENADSDVTIGMETPTVSPLSPPIAETTSENTESLSKMQTQPDLAQLRGSTFPRSYNTYSSSSSSTSTRSNVSSSHSHPSAIMDYTPDIDYSLPLITATLCVASIFIAAAVLVLLYCLCRSVKRRRALDSPVNVRNYLKRYDEHDVRVLNSSLGGWHVVLGRRLADRVRYYWTNELPGADEASTILFEDDHTILSHHTAPASSKSVGHEALSPGSCDTSSCGSLSSDDREEQLATSSHDGPPRGGQVLSFRAIAFHEAEDSTNPGSQGRSSTCPAGNPGRLDKHQIQSFIHKHFPSDKILISESFPAGGFSAIYCNRLDDNNDVSSFDRIDFYPSDIDRIHDRSQPLFKEHVDDDEYEEITLA